MELWDCGTGRGVGGPEWGYGPVTLPMFWTGITADLYGGIHHGFSIAWKQEITCKRGLSFSLSESIRYKESSVCALDIATAREFVSKAQTIPAYFGDVIRLPIQNNEDSPERSPERSDSTPVRDTITALTVSCLTTKAAWR